jgi:hypothetical protein
MAIRIANKLEKATSKNTTDCWSCNTPIKEGQETFNIIYVDDVGNYSDMSDFMCKDCVCKRGDDYLIPTAKDVGEVEIGVW